jgi:hypothetical protein
MKKVLQILAFSVACTFAFGSCSGKCEDTCAFANDGVCDDGGSGSQFSVCELGTDCADCGER